MEQEHLKAFIYLFLDLVLDRLRFVDFLWNSGVSVLVFIYCIVREIPGININRLLHIIPNCIMFIMYLIGLGLCLSLSADYHFMVQTPTLHIH